jgi:hypothetical protein
LLFGERQGCLVVARAPEFEQRLQIMRPVVMICNLRGQTYRRLKIPLGQPSGQTTQGFGTVVGIDDFECRAQ